MPPRTSAGKRVKSFFLSGYRDLTTGQSLGEVLDERLVQDDIRVIGVELVAESLPLTELDSGNISIDIDLSRSAGISRDSQIAYLINVLHGRSVTVAATFTEVAVGEITKAIVVMFPEGYGVDFDDQETMYLNVFCGNGMANTHRVFGSATVYYVER